MVDESPANSLPAGMTGRGLRGRRLARLMFVIAIVPAVLLGLLFISAPNYSHGMDPVDPGPLPTIVLGAGIFAYLFGLAVMIRIYRADPEAGPSRWRFRGF